MVLYKYFVLTVLISPAVDGVLCHC